MPPTDAGMPPTDAGLLAYEAALQAEAEVVLDSFEAHLRKRHG